MACSPDHDPGDPERDLIDPNEVHAGTPLYAWPTDEALHLRPWQGSSDDVVPDTGGPYDDPLLDPRYDFDALD